MNYAQFIVDLHGAYRATNKKRLRKEFLTDLITQFTQLYVQAELTPEGEEIYLRACVVALSDFTAKIHPYCLEPEPTQSIFTETHNLYFCVFEPTKNGDTFVSGMRDAYDALAAPFKQDDIKSLFPNVRTYPFYIRDDRSFPEDPLPFGSSDSAKRAYDRRWDAFYEKRRKHDDKALDDALEKMQCYESPFLGTPLFQYAHRLIPNLTVKIPFSIPYEERFSGMWCVAPPKRGKTTLLSSMFVQDLDLVAKDRASIVILDSKGVFANYVKGLQLFAPGELLHGKLLLIEPDPNHPVALNPLHLDFSRGDRKQLINRTLTLLDYLFAVLIPGEISGPQMRYLRAVTRAVLEVFPRPTIRDIYRLLIDGYENYEEYISRLDDRSFFSKEQFYSPNFKATRDSLIGRLGLLLDNYALAPMFEARETRLDFPAELDRAKVIVINNSWDALEDDGCEFFGRFFIYLLRKAAERRVNLPQDRKMPVFVYMDEAHAVIKRDENVQRIVQQCRDQMIAMIFAHQSLRGQIQNEGVIAALSDCAIRFFNSDEEKEIFARKSRAEKNPELLEQPPGHFVTFVRDHPPNPRVVYVERAPNLPRMTPTQEAAIREEIHSAYCVPVEPGPRPYAARQPASPPASPPAEVRQEPEAHDDPHRPKKHW